MSCVTPSYLWPKLRCATVLEKIQQSMTCDTETQRDEWSMLLWWKGLVFSWPSFHSFLMGTWMNWKCSLHLQGQADKYYAMHLLRCVTSSRVTRWKAIVSLWGSRLQDMCYFKLNLQGPKVIYLCQSWHRMEFWETTINSLWMWEITINSQLLSSECCLLVEQNNIRDVALHSGP